MRGASNGARGPWRCQLALQGIHFHTKSRIRDRGFVLLRHVQHALLLKPRAGTGRRRKSNLPPLVCLMEAVELRKDEGARPVSWAGRVRQWRWRAGVCRSAAARA